MKIITHWKVFLVLAFMGLSIDLCTAQTKKLIHFWDFNNTVPLTGQGDASGNSDSLGNSKNALPAVYTTLPLGGAKITYVRPFAIQTGASLRDSILDNATVGSDYYDYSGKNYPYFTTSDSAAASGPCTCNGNLSIRARNPSLNSYLYMFVPTTGYINISLDYAASIANVTGAEYNVFSYSTDGGTTWNKLTTAMDTFNIGGVKKPDTLMILNSVTSATKWYPVNINFTSANTINNNAGFIIRFYLAGPNSIKNSGSDRYDNIAIRGDSICPVIWKNPQNISVCPLTDTIFTVGVEGGLNNSFQWQVNTGGGFANVANGGVYSGATTDSLKLSGIPTTMNGNQFRCIIICPACNNDTSVAGTLSMKAYPLVTAHATSISICSGNNVTLTGGGALSYTWTGGATNGTSFVPVSTQTYIVTGLGVSGCSDTASVKVTVNALPIVSANASSDSVCFGSNITLTGGGAKTYTWTGGATNGIAFFPALSQTYTVTGTDSNSCVNTASVKVTVNTLPNIKANTTSSAVCLGSNVTLTGSGASTYAWTNAVVNGTPFAPTTTQNYVVTGTDAHGCINKDSIVIKVNTLPVVTANAIVNTVCAGGKVTLTGGGAKLYTWTGGVINDTAFTPPGTQTYTVTGTDINGCVDTASIKIKVNALPIVVANTTLDSLCAGGTITLTGSGAKTYVWSGGVTNGSAFAPASTQTYTVTGTDSNGCMNKASVTVIINALPPVKANATSAAICIGSSVTLTGSGAITYAWTGGASNGVAFILPATQSYTVTGTDSKGCVNKDSITITVNPLPVVTASTTADSVCAGNKITLSGSGAITYSWTGGATNGTPFSPATTQTYTLTGTDANGCKDTASIYVKVNTLPVITIIGNTSICSGSSTGVIASGGNTYVWSNAATSSSITVSPGVTTTYTVQGNNGICPNVATVTVTVTPTPVPVLNNNESVCVGNSVDLNASGGTTYSWSPALGLSSTSVANPSAFPAINTTYTVVMANGTCTARDSVVVVVNPLPVETATPATINIGLGESTPLSVAPQTAGSIYEWGPAAGLSCTNCPDPIASPLVNTVYTVVTTSGYGCSTTDTVTITVTDDCGHLFVPNIFSPNGDGHNDQLKVYGICVKTMEFIIYDRWGNKIFESNDQNIGWDGTYKGQRMNKGAYAYDLQATLLDGTEVKMSGNAALIR